MGHALFRPLFAFILLVGCLARSSGFELHRCPANAAAQGARHEEHQHGHGSLPGADRCECVGQSCTTSVAVPVTRTILAGTVVTRAALAIPGGSIAARPAIPHLLPFASGPPA